MDNQRTLGCARCRYSAKGCSRCRNPCFKPRIARQAFSDPASQAAVATAAVEGALQALMSVEQLPRAETARSQGRKRHQRKHDQQQKQQLDVVPPGPPQLPHPADQQPDMQPTVEGAAQGAAAATPAAALDFTPSSSIAKRLRRALHGNTPAATPAAVTTTTTPTTTTGPVQEQQGQQQEQTQEQKQQVTQEKNSDWQGSEQPLVMNSSKADQVKADASQPSQLASTAAAASDDAAAAGCHAVHAAAAASAAPGSSTFAATLEARIKQQLSQGRRPVLSPPGSKAKRSRQQQAAVAAADSDHAADAMDDAPTLQQQPVGQSTGQGERQKQAAVSHQTAGTTTSGRPTSSKAAAAAALAAQVGALAAAAVSDGSCGSRDTPAAAARSTPRSTPQHLQIPTVQPATPKPSTPSTSIDTAEAAVAAAAAAAGVSPTTPSSSKTPGSASTAGQARRTSGPKKPKPYAHLALPGLNPREPLPGWQAPASPFGLLEEELWQQPWKLLLGCMLLNKTSGKQVRRVFWRLLELCPTPEAAIAADTAAIRDIIAPLGLHNKRAVAVQRLSDDFLHKDWTCPTELYGIGKYAADAYYMFCRGQWEGVQPDDKDLIKYHEWLRATGGQGTGLAPAAADSRMPATLVAADDTANTAVANAAVEAEAEQGTGGNTPAPLAPPAAAQADAAFEVDDLAAGDSRTGACRNAAGN